MINKYYAINELLKLRKQVSQNSLVPIYGISAKTINILPTYKKIHFLTQQQLDDNNYLDFNTKISIPIVDLDNSLSSTWFKPDGNTITQYSDGDDNKKRIFTFFESFAQFYDDFWFYGEMVLFEEAIYTSLYIMRGSTSYTYITTMEKITPLINPLFQDYKIIDLTFSSPSAYITIFEEPYEY